MSSDENTRTIAEWFQEGVRCFQQPDGIGAVRAFEKVIGRNPAYLHTDGDNPYFYLGKIHEMENRLEDAIICYTRALTLDPYDEESLIGRGSCHTVLNRCEEAVADFKRVLQLPDRIRKVPEGHCLYAIAENYRKQGDYRQALHWGDKALQAEPQNRRHQQLVIDMTAKLGLQSS